MLSCRCIGQLYNEWFGNVYFMVRDTFLVHSLHAEKFLMICCLLIFFSKQSL